MSQPDIGIRLTVDSANYRADLQAADRSTAAFADSAERANQRVGAAFDQVTAGASRLRGAVLAVVGAMSARELVEMADSAALLDGRLRNATKGAQEYADAQAAIYRIAQANSVGLNETAQLYLRLAEPVRALGGTARETAGISEALALALRIGGASAAEASSAVLQFGQAMASGTLRGDEFASVAEASPRLLQALSESLGVSRGALRGMAEDGRLTSDVVGNALLRSLGALRTEAAGLPDTVGGALTRLSNEAQIAVGAFDKLSGSSATLAQLVSGAATVVATLGKVFNELSAEATRGGPAFDVLGAAITSVGTAFEAMLVVGANTKFALGTLVGEVTAVGRALAAAATGDFSGAGSIYGAWVRDSREARAEVDRFTERVLGLTQRAHEARAALASAAGTTAATNFANLRGEVTETAEQLRAAKRAAEELAKARQAELDLQARRALERQRATQAKEEAADRAREEAERLRSDAAQRAGALSIREAAAADRELDQLIAGNESLLRQIDLIGLDTAARAAREQAIERETIARLELDLVMTRNVEGTELEVQRIEREIAARRRRIDLIGQQATAEVGAESARAVAQEWQRTTQVIEQSLTDALLRGFESGKGFGRNLVDTLRNLFGTLVLRPVIRAIVAPVTGAFGMGTAGTAAAGTAGGSPLGLLGSVGGLVSGFGSYAATGFANAAIGTGFGANLTAAQALYGGGNLSGAAGLAAGGLAAYGAGLGVGVYGGRALSGGYAISGSGNGAVNLGTIAGAIVGGPIGAAIGGLIGGAANRLFGTRTVGSGIEGTLGGATGFEGNTFTDVRGGLFRRSRTDRGALDGGTLDSVRSTVGEIRAATEGYARALGLPTDAVRAFTQAIRIDTQGLSTEQVQQRVRDVLQSFSDGLVGALGGAVLQFSRTGETATQTLERLAGSLTSANATLQALGQRLLEVSAGGANVASVLVDMFGGADAFGQAASQYLQAIVPEADRLRLSTDGVARALGEVGVAMPATREEFRRLVEAQDLTSEAGRNAYVALLRVAPTFGEIAQAAEQAADEQRRAAEQQAEEAKRAAEQQADAARRLAQQQAEAAQRVRDAWADVAVSLDQTIRSLRGDVGGAAAVADFQALTNRVRGGDAGAVGDLTSSARSLIDRATAGARSPLEAARARAAVLASLTETAAVSRSRATTGEPDLSLVSPATAAYVRAAIEPLVARIEQGFAALAFQSAQSTRVLERIEVEGLPPYTS